MKTQLRASACAALTLLAGAAHAQRVVDGFETAADWKTIASEGVEITTSSVPGREGQCLRIDYNFKVGSGFCIVQRELALSLPEGNFELAFDVRGEGPANDLEFKILDTGGDMSLNAEKSDVWWLNRRGYEPRAEWTTLRNVRRNISYAWGPTGGKNGLKRADKIEFAIASKEGGKGTIYLDSLRLREIAAPPQPIPAPIVTTSAAAVGSAPAPAIGVAGELWRPAQSDSAPSVTIDFGYAREFSALTLRGENLREYTVLLSDDGKTFRESRRFEGRVGVEQLAPLYDVQSRYVRISFPKNSAPSMGLGSIAVHEPEEYPDAAAVALHDAPKEQRYWTVLGRPGDVREALINEDGIVEVNSGGFSLAPRVIIDGVSFVPEALSVYLEDDYLPIATAAWKAGPLRGVTTAWVPLEGPARLNVEFNIVSENWGEVLPIPTSKEMKLVVDVLPRQVNPKWQFLTTPGGFSPIRSIERSGDVLRVNGTQRIGAFPAPEMIGAASFAGRATPSVRIERLADAQLDSGVTLRDDEGLASGALVWNYVPHPGADVNSAASTCRLCIPFDDVQEISAPGSTLQTHDAWQPMLERASFIMPRGREAISNTVKSTLAHILINADGPAIQPGSRSYERSWIRDGALTSAALLKFGFEKEAIAFLDWYADHLIEIEPGVYKAPCVVDTRGPDPVPENDSHGEYIFAVYNAYMHTKDRSILERHWPKIRGVFWYIDRLRGSRMTAEFRPNGPRRQEPGKPAVDAEAFFGLMPESISHEGYSSKPMHSHWDNLWTLRGLECGKHIAEVLDLQNDVDGFDDAIESMRFSLVTSVRVSSKNHGIAYMPGCVELGDFDSTSTTVAVWPCDVTEVDGLTQPVLNTFEKYWTFFEERAATGSFEAFTPYELRHPGVFARLGMRDRAGTTLDWFMNFRRPAEWNQWAEVVWHDPRTPKFIGDMPHTWCGSDFLNSISAMCAYEHNGAVLLFRGIPAAWMDGEGGVEFQKLRTWFGEVSGKVVGHARDERPSLRCEFTLSGNAAPPGGFIIDNPRTRPIKRCTVNGQIVPADNGSAHIRSLPATVIFEYDDGSIQ